jgi:hypothetical protein
MAVIPAIKQSKKDNPTARKTAPPPKDDPRTKSTARKQATMPDNNKKVRVNLVIL